MTRLPYPGTLPAGGLEISGARNDDGVLTISVRTDDISPAEIFSAGTGGLADLGDLQDRGGGGQEERGDEGSPPS